MATVLVVPEGHDGNVVDKTRRIPSRAVPYVRSVSYRPSVDGEYLYSMYYPTVAPIAQDEQRPHEDTCHYDGEVVISGGEKGVTAGARYRVHYTLPLGYASLSTRENYKEGIRSFKNSFLLLSYSSMKVDIFYIIY